MAEDKMADKMVEEIKKSWIDEQIKALVGNKEEKDGN